MSFWKDKRVWIVGASSGIGEGLVYSLAKSGAKLLLSSRNENRLLEIVKSLSASDIGVIPLDIGDHRQLNNLTQQAWETYSGLDVVFLNAGISVRDRVVDTEVEVEKKLMDVNFWGPVIISKKLLQLKTDQGQLHLVVTSSLSGKYGVPKLASYAASKHALHGYFESLRAETHGNGLFIHLAIPGFVRTDITVNGLNGDGSVNGKMQKALAKGMDPLTCAQDILVEVEKGKEEFVVGGMERHTVWLSRLFPGVMKKMIRSNPVQKLEKWKQYFLKKSGPKPLSDQN